MKIYRIANSEQLKVAAQYMKTPNLIRKVQDVAAVWSAMARKRPERPAPITVTMELGRSAVLFKECNGEREPLGPMYVIGAREFAKELIEA